MEHNEIILDPESKQLLHKTIHDAYNNNKSYYITISFIEQYLKINDIINTIPTVLCNIICEYVNDSMLFGVLVSKDEVNSLHFNTVTLNICPKNVRLHNTNFDISFDIYTYKFHDFYNQQLNTTYPLQTVQDVHVMKENSIFSNKTLENSKNNTFLLYSLNMYMKEYYKQDNYYGNNGCELQSNITVSNHELMLYFCTFVKILIMHVRHAINELNYKLTHSKN